MYSSAQLVSYPLSLLQGVRSAIDKIRVGVSKENYGYRLQRAHWLGGHGDIDELCDTEYVITNDTSPMHLAPLVAWRMSCAARATGMTRLPA